MDERLTLHASFLTSLVRSRLRRASASALQAEDIVQEVFASFLDEGGRRLEAVDPSGLKAYLAAAVLNTARLRLRALSRGAVRERRHPLRKSPEAPDEPLLRREREEALASALARLPWEQQLLLNWVYWQGLTYSRVAVLAGLSPNSVGSALQRARERLAEELKKSAPGESLTA